MLEVNLQAHCPVHSFASGVEQGRGLMVRILPIFPQSIFLQLQAWLGPAKENQVGDAS